MSLEDTIKSMYNHTKSVYEGIVELGGTAPAEKNLANLVAAFDTLPVKPYDPENPTIKGISAAVKAGDFEAFPVGTEIPDKWDGQDNPLIVAQYLDSSNNSAYDGDVGVILMRKYVDPVSKVYNSAGMTDYDSSELYDYLANEYYTKCTPELRQNIDRIHEPFLQYNGNRMLHGYSNIFLMSGIEVGFTYNSGEGIFWDYWKQKTGLSAPSNLPSNGRIVKDRNDDAKPIWLRSKYNSTQPCVFGSNGATLYDSPAGSYGVLACCFIPGKDPRVIESLDELKAKLDAGKTIPIGAEIPDEYDGHSNPLIVAQQLDSSNNSAYGGAEGVILVRKYVENYGQVFDTNGSVSYSISTIKNFLDNDYLDKSSESLKNTISPINIPYYNGNSIEQINSKWFLISNKEIGSSQVSWNEGFNWKYLEEFAHRIAYDTSETARPYWLRSRYNTSNVTTISASGSDGYKTATSTAYGVLPACFIAKSTPSTTYHTVTFEADGATNVPAPQTVAGGGSLASQKTQ